jgi:hypothetical protein
MQIELGLEGVVTNSMGTAHIVYSVLFVAWPATNMGQHAISLNDGPSGKRSSHGLREIELMGCSEVPTRQ